MMHIDDYRPIVGDQIINELFLLAQKLKGKSIQNVNSTLYGGGVAEILSRMVPLMKDLGLDVYWDAITGDEKFFDVTKGIHNALHGTAVNFTRDDFHHFIEINKKNMKTFPRWADIMFIHDPQPIGFIRKSRRKKHKWIWRCHIDFSNPQTNIWQFLKKFINSYDAAVFSAPAFGRKLKIPQTLISPSIDPLSDKNKDLDQNYIDSVLNKYNIDKEKPIITQISRFDYLKDPVGVIKAYQLVKKYIDCQLVLAGGGAADDPEGMKVLAEVEEAATNDKDIFVLHLPPDSHLEINALQRASTVILQKSLKEGFGLTVSEALWKEKPVIASNVGGIPLQIAHKYSGILSYTIEGTAYWIKHLIHEPEYAEELGVRGKQHVKNNFLITRHIQEYLLLFLSLYNNADEVLLT